MFTLSLSAIGVLITFAVFSAAGWLTQSGLDLRGMAESLVLAHCEATWLRTLEASCSVGSNPPHHGNLCFSLWPPPLSPSLLTHAPFSPEWKPSEQSSTNSWCVEDAPQGRPGLPGGLLPWTFPHSPVEPLIPASQDAHSPKDTQDLR